MVSAELDDVDMTMMCVIATEQQLQTATPTRSHEVEVEDGAQDMTQLATAEHKNEYIVRNVT